jgi:hypothetical protein
MQGQNQGENMLRHNKNNRKPHRLLGGVLLALFAFIFTSVVALVGCDTATDDFETGESALIAAEQVGLPSTMHSAFTVSECQNSPGPYIVMNGEIGYEGLGLRLIFRNNKKATHEHTEEFVTTLVILPEGESITLPKQPALGGVGGNPFIWMQLLDDEGQALTGEIFLGRCVQGLSETIAWPVIPADAVLNSVVAECSNHPGPFITVDGNADIAGMTARFIFRNNDNPVGGPHEAVIDGTADLVLTPPTSVTFPKQPVLGGAGGNPWIFAQFIDGDGNPLSNEVLIGRCVKLQ